MNNFNCCRNSEWKEQADLGHANLFDFILGKCSIYNKYWSNLFCIPTAISGFEEVTNYDAEKLIEPNRNNSKNLKLALKE